MKKVQSGFKSLQDSAERDSAKRLGGGFIQYLRLVDDGDIARFRIVTSHNEDKAKEEGMHSHLIHDLFHRVEMMSQSGKKYIKPVLCGLEDDGAGNMSGECMPCEAGVPVIRQYLIWTYVYDIYHRRPGDGWIEDKLGEMKVFREPVNRFMIWQDGYFPPLESVIERNGTLTDRMFERERHGARNYQQTRYTLLPKEVIPIEADVLEASVSLPDLELVANDVVRTMSPPADVTATVPASGQTSYTEVDIDDDDDDLPF